MWRVLSSMPPGKKAGLSPPSPLPNQYPYPVWDPRGTPRRQQIATSNGPEGATDLGVYAGVMGLGNGPPSASLITAVICLGWGSLRVLDAGQP